MIKIFSSDRSGGRRWSFLFLSIRSKRYTSFRSSYIECIEGSIIETRHKSTSPRRCRYTCHWRLVEPITQFVRAVPFRGALLETFLLLFFFFLFPSSPQKVAQCGENERRALLSGEPRRKKGEGGEGGGEGRSSLRRNFQQFFIPFRGPIS